MNEPIASVPEKFRDSETGAVDLEALIASYLELERKLSRTIEPPADDADAEALARFHRALGVPERSEDYALAFADDDPLEADPEVNRRLHAAGFTPAQAQLVYDLAREYVLPAVREIGTEFEANRQLEQLHQHYGGTERFQEIAQQLRTWGEANLPAPVFEALASTREGIVALESLMESGEPGIAKTAGGGEAPGDQAALDALMRDPRYWRERDPEIMTRVRDGFRRLYQE